jgi:DNA mismatch repair protein MutS
MFEDADDEPPAPATDPATQALVERLREIDPNDLRPRDALDLLFELHELAKSPDARH